MSQTTIAAPATVLQPSGVALIRVSGPLVKRVLAELFQAQQHPIQHPRSLVAGRLVDIKSGTTVDRCMAVYFPGPKSFTGEDICEFHLHGSPLLVQTALRLLYDLGVQPAKPGEFSERAFLAGKIDLTQAEAIADLIAADSTAQLKVAQQHLGGRLNSIINQLSEPLKDCLAELEAHIDFPEEDINPASIGELSKRLAKAQESIDQLLGTYDYGKVLRDGLRVLIFGQPNVGKSSLLNYFMREERAIVTPISGTTRDTLEEQVQIEDLRFIFCDTAGVIETQDSVERLGIKRARDRLKWANLVLFTVDVSNPTTNYKTLLNDLNSAAVPVWLILNKIDLSERVELPELILKQSWPLFEISIVQGTGLKELEQALVKHVKGCLLTTDSASTVITNERHRYCLDQASQALRNTTQAIDSNQPLEVISAELRLTLSALAELIGGMTTEDLLGRIFGKFCIGK